MSSPFGRRGPPSDFIAPPPASRRAGTSPPRRSAPRPSPAPWPARSEDHRRMRRRQPQHEHDDAVPEQRQAPVGERLGRGVDGRARGGLGGVAGGRERPPSSAAIRRWPALSAPSAPAASAAPAGMRTTRVQHIPHGVDPGILSAKNSTSSIKPLAPSISGCCSTCRPGGSSTQPMKPARPVEKHRRHTGASRWPSRGGGHRHAAASCRDVHASASQDGLRLLEERLHALAAFVARADVGDAARGLGTQCLVDVGAPAMSCTSALQARSAIGPLAHRAATISSTLASSSRARRTTSCTKPSACACAALKRSAVMK